MQTLSTTELLLKEIVSPDARELREVYLAANTPNFMYSRYMKLGSIRSLASTFSAKDLVGCITDIDASEERTTEMVVLAYACVVALTLKDYNEIEMALHGVSITNMKWIAEILGIWNDKRIPVIDLSFDASRSTSESSVISGPSSPSNILDKFCVES